MNFDFLRKLCYNIYRSEKEITYKSSNIAGWKQRLLTSLISLVYVGSSPTPATMVATIIRKHRAGCAEQIPLPPVRGGWRQVSM